MPDTWKAIAARKLEEREAKIPREWRLSPTAMAAKGDSVLHVPRSCGLLTDDELKITEHHDATSLVALLATGSLSSAAVTAAFCKRAAVAHQVTNCLTEIFFDEALVRAKALDRQLAKTGRPTGPLHGLPISLKDSFKVQGYDASVGVANLCFKPAESNAALVDLLLSLGAVLYCKTNVPQSMMALDSHNNVFGRTLNPANLRLTAGGSTGGEGALIALRGSVLGVGTDVGGSIRIPAACNALFGIKPSHGRVPFAGQEGGHRPGLSKLGIEAVAGPLASSVRDCELFMRAVSDHASLARDPDVLPQTWAQQDSLSHSPQRKLRIGLVRTDGHVAPLPPLQTLFDEILTTLRASSPNIEVVEVNAAPLLARTLKPFNGIMSIDGANTWFDHFAATGEPLSPWLQGRLTRRPQKSVDEAWDLQGQKTALQTAFLDLWHERAGYWLTDDSRVKRGERVLDALIVPVAPHPIAPIDGWNTANYTGAFNLLDLPAGVVPVRAVTRQDTVGEVPSSPPLNGWDKVNRELWTKVDRNVYVGSMLSVQVVTPRLQERRLVEIMGKVSEALAPLSKQSRGGSRL